MESYKTRISRNLTEKEKTQQQCHKKKRRNLFVLREECFFRLGSVYKPNIMYIQFINTFYKPHGSTNITSKTTILYHISCYVSKTCAYWPNGLASQHYVPCPLAPLKPLTLTVRQSHWPYVLRLSIWWWLSSLSLTCHRSPNGTHKDKGEEAWHYGTAKARKQIIPLQLCYYSKSFEFTLLSTAEASSYWYFIVTMALSHTISEIFNMK